MSLLSLAVECGGVTYVLQTVLMVYPNQAISCNGLTANVATSWQLMRFRLAKSKQN